MICDKCGYNMPAECCGIGNYWDDIRLPGLDYLLVENTLGKFGRKVETFNKLPVNVQELVSF